MYCKWRADGSMVCHDLPVGTFKQTCKKCRIDEEIGDNTLLRCDCAIKRGDESTRDTFIPFNSCKDANGITNCAGYLKCGACYNDVLRPYTRRS